MDKDRERDAAEEDGASPSRSDLLRAKLKIVAHYVMLGFAPVVSVVALVIAVIAVVGNRPDQMQDSGYAARIESLNASLSETKGELENLKFAMAREKTLRGEERKKMDERDTKIIQNVTHLQVKMKVAPTLEDQLREAASAPAAASSVASAASAPAAAVTTAPTATTEKPAAAPAVANKKPAPASNDKAAAQAKALKEAIEKFNKN